MDSWRDRRTQDDWVHLVERLSEAKGHRYLRALALASTETVREAMRLATEDLTDDD